MFNLPLSKNTNWSIKHSWENIFSRSCLGCDFYGYISLATHIQAYLFIFLILSHYFANIENILSPFTVPLLVPSYTYRHFACSFFEFFLDLRDNPTIVFVIVLLISFHQVICLSVFSFLCLYLYYVLHPLVFVCYSS